MACQWYCFNFSFLICKVVCPLTGDHFEKAAKAAEMKVGIDLGRPDCDRDEDSVNRTIEKYRLDVASAVRSVLEKGSIYSKSAKQYADKFGGIGGVTKGVDIIVSLADDAISA